jgi:hypothetical protein
MKKPIKLDSLMVAAKKASSPHLRLSPRMGDIPCLLEIADGRPLQPGEVQMSTSMENLFKWKDTGDAADLEDACKVKILTLMTRHKDILCSKIEFGRSLTWGSTTQPSDK